jgi:hypothetical protein
MKYGELSRADGLEPDCVTFPSSFCFVCLQASHNRHELSS